jgi:hypothetical protein
MGLENKEARAKLEKNVTAYKRAIQFIDSCGALTPGKVIEARRIAGAGPDDAWFNSMWEKSQNILQGVGPGTNGREQLRYGMRKTLSEAVAQFEQLLGSTTTPKKKSWQFWK